MLQKLLQQSFRALVATCVGLCFAQQTLAADLQLPQLGENSAGLISPKQEFELGQKWLRIYRSQVPTTSDPFIQVYVENMVRKLAAYSELKDRRLDILVIENPTLNAFAVPGGIIGVNTGILKFADTEEQMSSVIAHELAHLSQRHYARQVEKQQNSSTTYLAAFLASILLGVAAGTDAGIAAISATQAAALDSQLRFSRQMEQEADRLGMETLVRSGMDPYAMAGMFENMLRATRFQRRPPEFLLSHPVTESRVTEARLRAQQYPSKPPLPVEEYDLIKARAYLLHEKNHQTAVNMFESEMRGTQFDRVAARYGLVLALTRNGETERATREIAPLLAQEKDNVYFQIAKADIYAESGDFAAARKVLEANLKKLPNSHPLNTRYAEVLMMSGDYQTCKDVLRAHVQRRPKDDYIWYLTAEVEGLAGNIYEVHVARAEYFKLNGLYDKAEIQLTNAMRLTSSKSPQARARLEEQLREVREMRREMKDL
ncbi:M48 family metalloprotease [Teredinibacter turnerae]|uniref:M48 family metalloprotease n=1 Tax=Teredinibacter turnerae TaxID=2426 RepID=UPI0003700D74|nr:M48 family metalloprotease [Teredinibacter turnerae]